MASDNGVSLDGVIQLVDSGKLIGCIDYVQGNILEGTTMQESQSSADHPRVLYSLGMREI